MLGESSNLNISVFLGDEMNIFIKTFGNFEHRLDVRIESIKIELDNTGYKLINKINKYIRINASKLEKLENVTKTRSPSIEPIETVSFTAPDNDSIYSSSIQSTSTIFSYNYIIESILFEIKNNLKIDKNKIGFIFSQYSTHEFNEFDNIGRIFQRIFKELKMFQ
jgi:hypothetical protein